MSLAVHYKVWDPNMLVKDLNISWTNEPDSRHILKNQEDPDDALKAGEMGDLVEWIKEKYDPDLTFGEALVIAVEEYST